MKRVYADVAKLADALGLGSSALTGVEVQVLSSAPNQIQFSIVNQGIQRVMSTLYSLLPVLLNTLIHTDFSIRPYQEVL